MKNNWIEVNLEGLKEMVDKKHCLRELIANAFDEQINGATECKVDITSGNHIMIFHSPKKKGKLWKRLYHMENME